MVRIRLWLLCCLLLPMACRDHPQLLQPQVQTCLVQHIKIAYTDPARHQHWSTHQYDELGRIRITTDSSATWQDSTRFTYSGAQAQKTVWIKGFSNNPLPVIYNLTPLGYLQWPGYYYDQAGYLVEIDTPNPFHQVYTYQDGNLVKQVLDDGRYQVTYTYEYDTTRPGVPFSMDNLDLFTGKPSRNLLLHVNATSGGIGSGYANKYTYADFHYEYDSLGRVSRCERDHFMYGHSISEYSYRCH